MQTRLSEMLSLEHTLLWLCSLHNQQSNGKEVSCYRDVALKIYAKDTMDKN